MEIKLTQTENLRPAAFAAPMQSIAAARGLLPFKKIEPGDQVDGPLATED